MSDDHKTITLDVSHGCARIVMYPLAVVLCGALMLMECHRDIQKDLLKEQRAKQAEVLPK